MSILVSGSLAYDYIMNFPDSFKNHILPEQLHILSVCFVVEKLERNFGGTAGNIAYTMKLLGADPIIASALGKDAAPYMEKLNALAINTKNIVLDTNLMSASAHITTDVDDNQVTAFYNGPLKRGMDINVVSDNSKIVLISPTHKDVMIAHLNAAADAGKTVVFDPGQQLTAFSDLELEKLIGRSKFVIGNDYEIKLIEKRTGLTAAKMADAGATVITTLGASGSVIATPEGEVVEVAPCASDSADDPTGAGDAYRAGFFVGLEKDFSLKTCAQMGSVAATYAVESYGTQEHKFSTEEFVKRYMDTYKETIEL